MIATWSVCAHGKEYSVSTFNNKISSESSTYQFGVSLSTRERERESTVERLKFKLSQLK